MSLTTSFALRVNSLTLRLVGYLSFIVFAGERIRQFRNPELRLALMRQLSIAGNGAFVLTSLLAMITGGLMLSQLLPLLGESSPGGRNLLMAGLNYEIAPMLCALIVLSRSSAGIASELALMNLNDEFASLERIGIPAAEYLLLPRIGGLAIAMPVLTVVFQVMALVGGIGILTLLRNAPLVETAHAMLSSCQPILILLGLLKASVFGILIAAISCHHGSHAERSPLAVSRESIVAVGRSLSAVVLFDALCAGAIYLLQMGH